MIPLKDKTLRRTVPYVNVSLILINIAVFLFEVTLPDAQLEAFVTTWGFIPGRFFDGGIPAVEVRVSLLTAMFLHGGWFHLGSNMLTLWIFGDNVEDRMGHLTYLGFYLASGVAASLAHGLLQMSSPIPVVGASGAIAGVLGAYLLLFPRAKVVTVIPFFLFFFVRDISALLFIGFWFVLQLFNGVAALDPQMAESGIAWWAHVGGFVVGLLFALPLGGRSRAYVPEEGYYRWNR